MNSLCKCALKTVIRNTVFSQTPCKSIYSGLWLAAVKSGKSEFADGNEKSPADKPKTISPKITLIAKDESVSIVSLAEAQKLAKRRDLKLVKILDLDTKTKRAIYKLMTGAEFHVEDVKRREEKKEAKKTQAIKGEKLLSLSSKITEHDLQAKLSNTTKWLQKHYEVRVVISNDSGDSQKAEHVAESLEKSAVDLGRVVQKRIKDGSIRFQILPNIKKADDPKLLDPSINDPMKMTTQSIHTDTTSSSS